MVIAASFNKFSSQISRISSISFYSKTISRPSFSSSSPNSSSSLSSSSSSSSAKISDRIIKIFAIDLDSKNRKVIGLTGQTLLKSLINGGLINPDSHRLEEIDACSAECEVNIAQEWLDKLPPPTYDEQYVLKQNALRGILNKNSRLGCQVILKPELQGMVVAIPKPKPWDIS